jgi:hypothetical protein
MWINPEAVQQDEIQIFYWMVLCFLCSDVPTYRGSSAAGSLCPALLHQLGSFG